MLAFVKGCLAETGTDYVVLDNQGIGYLIYTILASNRISKEKNLYPK